MSNFKSGAGDLDFGSGDKNDEEDEVAAETTENQSESIDEPVSSSSDMTSQTETSSGLPASDQVSEAVVSTSSTDEYPYFVRRSNVGDERDTRLEIHVRDKVAEQEAEFRSELAEHLGTSEVSKTDAREFALFDAFQNPERIADRMQEEGFGILD